MGKKKGNGSPAAPPAVVTDRRRKCAACSTGRYNPQTHRDGTDTVTTDVCDTCGHHDSATTKRTPAA